MGNQGRSEWKVDTDGPPTEEGLDGDPTLEPADDVAMEAAEETLG